MDLQQERPWSDLVSEILCLIFSKLHGKDVHVFRAVCRHWSSIPEPLNPKHITDPFSEIVKHPFLLRNQSLWSSGEIYSPAYSKTYYYFRKVAKIFSPQIHCSNHGWLLMSLGVYDPFFHNPSTGDFIELPTNPVPLAQYYNLLSFSAPPTSPDCVVFGLVNHSQDSYSVSMTFIRRGDRSWRNYEVRPNRASLDTEFNRLAAQSHNSRKRVIMVHQGNRCSFRSIPCKAKFEGHNSRSAPVFHNGAFYCLSQEGGGGRGRLGIFDPTKNKWRILDVGSCRYFFPTSYYSQSYLMESSRGELISVLVGRYGEFVTVFKLDEDLRLWQIVCNLGDQAAFLSPTSSMVLSCRELQVNGLENAVHFASFDDDGNYNIFYSLSTRKFHSFKNGYTSDDLFDSDFYLNSTWMVPNFQSFSRRRLNWKNSSSEKDFKIRSNYVCKSIFSQRPNDENRITEEVVAPIRRPLIILSHGEKKDACSFFDLVNLPFPSRDRMESSLRGKQVYGGSTDGRVVLIDFESRDCFLLNTSTMVMEPLPAWPMPDNFFKFCCLVHEVDLKSAVTIFGILKEGSDQNVVNLKCQVGDREWTTHAGGIRVYEAVAYRGTIYGIGIIPTDDVIKVHKMESRQGEWVEVVDTVSIPPTEFLPAGSTEDSWYLVESCGEILVFRVFWSEYNLINEVIMVVRAYKLDLKEMSWVEVKDFGDRAFFFCHKIGGFGCCASGSGFPRNNLYFAQKYAGNVERYNYEDHSIRTVFTCNDEYSEEGYKIQGLVMY